MPRRNRVDPWGDLHAEAGRGLFTGNRGCLVDEGGSVVRHHRSDAWITCLVEFGGRRVPLDAPRRWTPIFFLDDAVALAAGHRPCGYCRRADLIAYQEAVGRADAAEARPGAAQLDRRLAAERMERSRRGPRGLDWADRRRLWPARLDDLPTGTVVVAGAEGSARRAPDAELVAGDQLLTFGFGGWHSPRPRPAGLEVAVLTPPTSVAALANGFRPVLAPLSDCG